MRRVGGGGGCGGFQKWLHQSKAASNLLQSGGLFIRFKPGSDHLIDARLSTGQPRLRHRIITRPTPCIWHNALWPCRNESVWATTTTTAERDISYCSCCRGVGSACFAHGLDVKRRRLCILMSWLNCRNKWNSPLVIEKYPSIHPSTHHPFSIPEIVFNCWPLKRLCSNSSVMLLSHEYNCKRHEGHSFIIFILAAFFQACHV